jgi:hypothetical protein
LICSELPATDGQRIRDQRLRRGAAGQHRTPGAEGSLFPTRHTLVSYTAPARICSPPRELIAVVKSGAVKIKINQTYPLREAAGRMPTSSRETTGSTVLRPSRQQPIGGPYFHRTYGIDYRRGSAESGQGGN